MQDTPAYLAVLRERSGLSQRELAGRCGLSNVAVWRACTPGWAIKGPTLDVLLREGLGFQPDSREYKKAVALWTRERLSGTVKAAEKSKVIEAVAGMSASELARLKKYLATRAGS